MSCRAVPAKHLASTFKQDPSPTTAQDGKFSARVSICIRMKLMIAAQKRIGLEDFSSRPIFTSFK
jgi:hypothetical protein